MVNFTGMQLITLFGVGGTFLLNIGGLAFFFGKFSARMENMERVVLDGMTSELKSHADELGLHAKVLAAIDERCKQRERMNLILENEHRQERNEHRGERQEHREERKERRDEIAKS